MKLNYPNQKYDELLIQLRNEVNRDEIKIIENKIMTQLLFCCDFIVCFERYNTIKILSDYTVKETLQEKFSQAIDEDLDRLIIVFTDVLLYFKWREDKDIDKLVIYNTERFDLLLNDANKFNYNGIVINPETDDIIIKNANLDNWRMLKNINNALECKTTSKMMKMMIRQVKYYAGRDKEISKVWIKRDEQDYIYIIVDANRNMNIEKLKEACRRIVIDDYFMIVEKYQLDGVFELEENDAIYDVNKERKYYG